MELNEITDLLKMNMTLYKNSAKPLTEQEIEATASVWFYHFKDYDSRTVKKAFLAANAVCVYPIQPADIFEQLRICAKEKSGSPEKLWQSLKQAVSKVSKLAYLRNYPKIIGIDEKTGKVIKSDGTKEMNELFDNLPQQVKVYLGSLNALADMAIYSDEELERYKKRDFFDFVEKQTNSQVLSSFRISDKNLKLLNGG